MSRTWEPVDGNDRESDQPRWTIYALGGGTGHWTRAISLARKAGKNGIATRILTNSCSRFTRRFDSDRNTEVASDGPLVSTVSAFVARFTASVLNFATTDLIGVQQTDNLVRLDPRIEIVSIPDQFDRNQIAGVIRYELSSCREQDVLIVDSFPCGIAGELRETLAELPSRKIFVHRDLNPEYVRWGNLEDAVRRFHLVISPGDDGPLSHLVHARTLPWMVCDADELLPRETARQLLGVDRTSELPLIVASGCGTSEEAIAMAQLARRIRSEFQTACHVRLASLDQHAVHEAGELGVSLWPLLCILPGVDLLIGSGGYHTVYESHVTETPLIAIPQQRLYDRQSRRIRESERAANEDDVFERVGNYLLQINQSKSDRRPEYVNGASKAFALIAESRRNANRPVSLHSLGLK